MANNDLDDDVAEEEVEAPDDIDEDDLEELEQEEEEADDEVPAEPAEEANDAVEDPPVPAPARARGDDDDEEEEDEDEDSDDVEASLDVILKERLVVNHDDEEEDEEEVVDTEDRGEAAPKVLPKQPGEFVCQSCFLVKHPSQLADPVTMLCRDCE